MKIFIVHTNSRQRTFIREEVNKHLTLSVISVNSHFKVRYDGNINEVVKVTDIEAPFWLL